MRMDKIISNYMLSPNRIKNKLDFKIYRTKMSLKKESQKEPRKYSACCIQRTSSTDNEQNIYFRNQAAEYFGPDVVANSLNWQNLKQKHFLN